MSLPFLGVNQFSEGYYYSLIDVNCFGIADEMGDNSNLLNAFYYFEQAGKKGGNNVVSLVYKFLKMKGLLNKEGPIGEITFNFDNCAGQNKNRIVLSFFCWLVEESYFLKANFFLFCWRPHQECL